MKIKMILSAMAIAALSSSCGNSALTTGIDQKNLDTKVNPGNDFYEYACGGWMKSHPLPADYSRFGTFEQLIENNNKQLRDLIEELANNKQSDASIEQKIGELYNLSMDSVRKNKEGIEPIRKTLDEISKIKTNADVLSTMASLERKGMMGYFNSYAEADMKNSDMNLVTVGQGGLTLGEREYYLDSDSATVKIWNGFKDYIVKVLQLCGESKEAAQTKMKAVIDIETKLAQASKTAADLRDPNTNYHKMSFVQLTNDYPGLDWKSYFNKLGYPEFKELSVAQPDAIHAVENIFKNTSIDDQKAFLEFHAIDAAADYLSDSLRLASFNFYGKTMSGLKKEKPTWKRAVKMVQDVMGEAVGHMYVDKYFPESSKERMLKLVKNLQKALGERIEAQTWMSDATKAKALDKLSSFYIKIGYPDKWRDYSKLKIDSTRSLCDNIMAATEFENDYQISEKVNKKVDRTKWYMDPQEVNAYYNPSTNEICFPAGILQAPFFDASADDAFNYGAIGVVIGHEMTHGFDDQGRQFDKKGNLNDWWTKSDADNFKKRAKVMSDFFSNIEILPGLKGNGPLTLGENLADHGGLQVSYQALQNALKEAPLDSADGYTPNQRFFLAYANVWAANITKEEIRVRTKSDPHSLGRWRVNGALPNIDAWYDAFKVTDKDKMFVPKDKRVNIW